MRRTRNKQIMTIAVIMVAVVGLAVGFAAFSANLTIQPGANVTPDASDFVVRFSSSATGYSTGDIDPSNPALGEVATISNEEPTTISNLVAKFKEPGDSVSYTFYVRNDGKYDAWLKSITFGNKTCQVTEGASHIPQIDLMNEACEDIDITLQIDDTIISRNDLYIPHEELYFGDNDGTYMMRPNDSRKVVVTINYAANGTRVDGDFSVNFGDIVLEYNTVYTTTIELRK